MAMYIHYTDDLHLSLVSCMADNQFIFCPNYYEENIGDVNAT